MIKKKTKSPKVRFQKVKKSKARRVVSFRINHECKSCGESFPQKFAFENHKKEHYHSECLQCNKKFKFDGHLERHMENFHSNKCFFCSDAFDCKENLSKHTEEVHKDDFKNCADCLEVFKTPKELLEHRIDYHEESGVYQCPISECSHTFEKLR